MNAPVSAIERLHLQLPDIDWITEPNRVTRLSQDFSWFSPVLKRELGGKRAEAVARPRNESEIRELVSACANLKVPITVRGGGTGNYGQAVPLQGGIVMDLSGFNAFLWARPGVARAQAGIRLADFDREARKTGWEMRCIPSTFRAATLGGLFGGGFGGAGSITWGPLGAPGNVLGIKIMTVEPQPRIIELRGPDAMHLHHVYGTNGLVLELEVGLAPAHDWLEQIVVFDSFDRALDFADAVAHAPGIAKKEVSFMAAPIPDYFTLLGDHLPRGCHAVFLLVADFSEATTLELVAQHGGRVTYRMNALEALAANRTIIEYCWNHTTLNALKIDKTLTYLQLSFTAGIHLQQVREMEKIFSGEVLMHAEFLRGMNGVTSCSALPLVRYTTDERLNEIIRIYREHGVRVNNPHVYHLEDGKAGGDLPEMVVRLKREYDPLNLLNPGKIRTYTPA